MGNENPGCFLCHSQSLQLFYQGGVSDESELSKAFLITDSEYHSYPNIYKCSNCELICSDPQAITASPLNFYEEMKDPEYHLEAEGRVIPFRDILNRAEKMGQKGLLLDIGAATGILLKEAQNKGWQVSGVEPSRWAVAEAKRLYNLDIAPGTIYTAQYEKNSFDVITLLDVIEHVDDPKSLLQEIHRILKPEGMLILSTPNIGSLVARLLGPKWWHIRRAHQYYFTWKTIQQLLKESGFSIIRKRYYPWAFSLHYWFSRFENFSRPVYKIVSAFERSKPGGFLRSKIIKFNFFDSFELYCRRK